MGNYFNQLTLAEKLDQLGQCRFMDQSEFEQGVVALKGKKIITSNTDVIPIKDKGLRLDFIIALQIA